MRQRATLPCCPLLSSMIELASWTRIHKKRNSNVTRPTQLARILAISVVERKPAKQQAGEWGTS